MIPLEKVVLNKPVKAQTQFKVCICIDMDAFYAQVEAKRLGLDSSVPLATVQYRGITSVNYAARKFGVKKFMNLEKVKELCPNIVFVHHDTLKLENLSNLEKISNPNDRDLTDKFDVKERPFEKINLDYYRFESDRIVAIMAKHCEIIEKASIDEVFMDITSECQDILNATGQAKTEWKGITLGGDFGEPKTDGEKLIMVGSQLAERIRQEVQAVYGYTSSAGISYNKMLSKVATGINKPNGQTIIIERLVQEALKPLEVKKIRNLGKKIGDVFENAGFKKIEDVLKLNLLELTKICEDETLAKYVYFRIRGFDDEKIEEKDFNYKTITSRKSFYPTTKKEDVEKIEELVVADLNIRVVRFYEQYKMIPQTLTLLYFDNIFKTSRSRAIQINLKMRKEHFHKILKEKTRELINSVTDVLYPCKFLGTSVRSFVKNDIESYGFDLITYAKQANEKSREKLEQSNSQQMKFDSMSFDPEQNAQIIKDEEKIKCEKCDKLINESEWIGHIDFHAAEELDRSLNPNKRKYKMLEAVEKPTDIQGSSKTSKGTDTKDQIKQNSKKVKLDPAINNMKIDSFFKKK